MPQYQASPIHTKAVARMNANRRTASSTIEDFTDPLPQLRRRFETLLTENRIWAALRHRGRDAGTPFALGFTGPMLRGSGVPWDREAAVLGLRPDGI
jgi:NADH-quinone oxidoreductase subunit D